MYPVGVHPFLNVVWHGRMRMIIIRQTSLELSVVDKPFHTVIPGKFYWIIVVNSVEVRQTFFIAPSIIIESFQQVFSTLDGSLRLHIVSMGIDQSYWFYWSSISNRSNPRSILVEFGIHDRYRIEPTRVARTIREIIVVCCLILLYENLD